MEEQHIGALEKSPAPWRERVISGRVDTIHWIGNNSHQSQLLRLSTKVSTLSSCRLLTDLFWFLYCVWWIFTDIKHKFSQDLQVKWHVCKFVRFKNSVIFPKSFLHLNKILPRVRPWLHPTLPGDPFAGLYSLLYFVFCILCFVSPILYNLDF